MMLFTTKKSIKLNKPTLHQNEAGNTKPAPGDEKAVFAHTVKAPAPSLIRVVLIYSHRC
jgi:hypothetical protein